MLRQIAEDEVRANRCNRIEPRFAKLAFYVIFFGETKTAKGLHAHVRCSPTRLRSEHFCHIGFSTRIAACIICFGGMMHHQLGCAHLCITARYRKLHALVLADGASEDLTVFRIISRFGDEPLGIADAFRRDQDAFRVHARKNIAEPFSFFPNQCRCRYSHIVEENFGGGMVHHCADRLDGHAIPHNLAHIDEEDG